MAPPNLLGLTAFVLTLQSLFAEGSCFQLPTKRASAWGKVQGGRTPATRRAASNNLFSFFQRPKVQAAKDTEIVVIGAGISGLVCARKLCSAGYDVQLVEASDGVGGRVRTDEYKGFLLDRGFQVFIEGYPAVREELDYDALRLKPFLPGALVRTEGGLHLVADPFRRPGDLLPALLAPVGTLVDKVKVGLYRVYMTFKPVEAILSDPEYTTSAFLRERLLGGLGEGLVQKFFTPFYSGIFLAPLEEQSSNLFEFVFKMFSIGSASLPQGGIGKVTQQLASDIPEGVVSLNNGVVKMEKLENRVGLTLADGQKLRAKAAVVATDGPAACRLLAESKGFDAKSEAVEPPLGRASTCVYLGLPAAPPVDSILVLNGEGCSPEKPVNNICFLEDAYAPPGRSLCSVTVVGNPPDNDAELVEKVRRQLQEWFPLVDVGAWEYLRTYRINFAQPAQNPPTTSSKSLSLGEGVFCCGDHRSSPTLNGAVASGQAVAQQVIESLS